MVQIRELLLVSKNHSTIREVGCVMVHLVFSGSRGFIGSKLSGGF